jgi:tyrosyl-tRNA synthetase
MSVIDLLQERGFISQMTHDEPLRKLLDQEQVTLYIGFDPTADSLHVGGLLQIMTLAHMQRAGHRPIALVGGGTAMIGDPSGRSELRKMMTPETIAHNVAGIKAQLSHYLDFSEGKAILVNNADWLLSLNYIEALREIGVHFSVNRMLTAECFKTRLERGLSFIEFNYMLLQSYDFLTLYRRYGCRLEMGGDDQWSNILGGVELIRRMEGVEAYGVTSPLLLTSSGKKMGKTEAGAVWLDPNRTSPYEFYQYWRNTEDADVQRFLALYTFLPMDEVRRLGALKDKEINEAKKTLAFEVTKLAHGEKEAILAQKAAEAAFGAGGDEEGMPSTTLDAATLSQGVGLLDLLVKTGLAPSKSEGRRLIEQGGIAINNKPVKELTKVVNESDLDKGRIIIRKGKKTFHRIVYQ